MNWFLLGAFFSLRLSLVFLCLTLGFAFAWIPLLADVVWDNSYDDFASRTFSAQYTLRQTATIIASPTTLTYIEMQTATYTGASATRTTTGTFTYTDTYTSGEIFNTRDTIYYSQITFTPSLATVSIQSCFDGPCTGKPATTQTLSPTATNTGYVPPPSASLDAAAIARNRDLHKRGTIAIAFTIGLLLCTLAHTITSVVFNLRFFRMLDIPVLSLVPWRQSSVNDDTQVACIRKSFRQMAWVYVVFTALDFVFGLPAIVVMSLHHNTNNTFLGCAIGFWATAITTSLATVAVLCSYGGNAHRDGDDDRGGADVHSEKPAIEEKSGFDHPEL